MPVHVIPVSIPVQYWTRLRYFPYFHLFRSHWTENTTVTVILKTKIQKFFKQAQLIVLQEVIDEVDTEPKKRKNGFV